ncbi:MAG: hypothetical protein PHW65_01610 [Dehalococcoidales bacterium]|nr:hypothetical protein [Dehalococcoidales bacterium]
MEKQYAQAAYIEAAYAEHHEHTVERWFGAAAVPTATHWGDESRLTAFQAISGNGDFGSDLGDEAEVLGSDDTPVVAGNAKFDAHRLLIATSSVTTAWVLRLVYGTGTMADAEAAGQYTDIMTITPAAPGPANAGAPFDIKMLKLAAGTKIWIRAKNATNNATIDFFVGLHEYAD